MKTNESDKYIEFDAKLDKYLRGEMTEEEEKEFKSLLESNSDLQERASITALMIRTMRKEDVQQNKQMIEDISSMSESEFRRVAGLKPKFQIWRKIYAYAAAACIAAILFCGGYFVSQQSMQPRLANALAGEYIAYVNLDQMITRGGDAAVELEAISKAIQDGAELPQVIEKLTEMHEEALGEYASDYEQYVDQIDWLLSMAYLRNGELKSPKPYLKGIIDRSPNSELAVQAKSLLSQL